MRGVVAIIALLGFSINLFAQSAAQSSNHLRYIERFSSIAMEEMVRAGIPASIKLAQGIHESGGGKSPLATRANNHFGIKCGRNWNGRETYREDDDYDQNGRLIESCFRGYRNPDASYRDHSEFLRDPAKMRYNFLFRLDPTDYVAWAEGLRRAGYATDPAYPQKLIRIIESYQLFQYDQQVMGESVFDDPVTGPVGPILQPPTSTPGNTGAPVFSGIGKTNDVSYFITGEAITVDELARRVDLSVRRIISYNDLLNDGSQRLVPGDRVYLQPKRNNYRGKDRYHTVLAGESLFDISQRYAIQMDKLLKRNRLDAGQEPAAGERIKLRGGRVSSNDRPELRSNNPTPTPPTTPNVVTDNNGQIDMDDTGVNNPATGTPSTPGTGTTNPPSTTPTEPPPTVVTPSPPPPPPAPEVNPPTTGDESTTVPTPPTNPVPTAQFHTVIRGETLYAISRRYGTSVDQLKALNQLTSNTIAIGLRLRVR